MHTNIVFANFKSLQVATPTTTRKMAQNLASVFFRLTSNRAVWWLALNWHFWISDKNAFAVRYLKEEKEPEHQNNITYGADWGPRNTHLCSTDHVEKNQ